MIRLLFSVPRNRSGKVECWVCLVAMLSLARCRVGKIAAGLFLLVVVMSKEESVTQTREEEVDHVRRPSALLR